jgi:hypothetical protein
MNQETNRLLRKLQGAILESLGGSDIEDAITAIESTGQRVRVSVDAVLEDLSASEDDEEFDPEDFLSLSPSDELFLRSLHILV